MPLPLTSTPGSEPIVVFGALIVVQVLPPSTVRAMAGQRPVGRGSGFQDPALLRRDERHGHRPEARSGPAHRRAARSSGSASRSAPMRSSARQSEEASRSGRMGYGWSAGSTAASASMRERATVSPGSVGHGRPVAARSPRRRGRRRQRWPRGRRPRRPGAAPRASHRGSRCGRSLAGDRGNAGDESTRRGLAGHALEGRLDLTIGPMVLALLSAVAELRSKK